MTMMKKLLALCVCCLWFVGAQAQEQPAPQEDKMSRLMGEREQLILEYQYYSGQNSNFWGKQSKKDLLNIIDTLKEIIRKDSELIGAIKEASVRKIAESAVQNQQAGKMIQQDERLINNQIADLKGQISTLESQAKKRERVILDLKEQLKSTDDVRFGKDRVIAILGAGAFLMFLYAVFLQIRLSNRKPAKKRKKA
jgi:CRISPR/Cas system-associated endoribonuclease Cas2